MARSVDVQPSVNARQRRRFAQSALAPALLVQLFLASSAVSTFGQTSDSLRLEQVTREVIEHNDRIASARYMEEASREKAGSAGAWQDPMLMVGVANLPTSFDFKEDPMTMTMVGLSQTIPYAGQKGLEAQAAKADADAATYDRYATEVDLAKAARYAFSDLYYRRRTLADLNSQLDLLETITAAAMARLSTNQAGQADVLAAQAEEWRLQARVLEAEHMVEEARYDLNILRGLDVDAAVPPLAAPPSVDLPATPEPWLAAARQYYPPLAKLSLQSEAYGFSSQAAQRMSWPMLQLSASYAFRFDAPNEPRDNMVNFQAAFTLPFLEGGRQKDMARAMDAMRQGVDAEAAQRSREIEARLRVLHMTAAHLVTTESLYRDRILPAALSAFQSALAGYASNQVPYSNLLLLATDVYRDRMALNDAGNQLSRTLAEAESFTRDPKSLAPEPVPAPQAP